MQASPAPTAAASPTSAEPPLPVDPEVLMRLRNALRARADERGSIRADQLERIAKRADVPLAFAYVAMGTASDLSLACEHAVQIKVCTAACLGRGSLDNIRRLLEIQKERAAQRLPQFDLQTRQCLDLCFHSPSMRSYSSFGMIPHGQVNSEALEELVDALCGA